MLYGSAVHIIEHFGYSVFWESSGMLLLFCYFVGNLQKQMLHHVLAIIFLQRNRNF